MLQAGLFADFKGADTLLLWGDAIGVADLRIAMAALPRGDGSRIPITSELSISACDVHEHASQLLQSSEGLEWICSRNSLADAEALLAGMEKGQTGHQYIDITSLADQVIASQGEYPASLRP